jgi:hypothetical protein
MADVCARVCCTQVVVDIDGDGSFLMNCQEMATAACERLDIKMFILNNQHLGMVVQWEDRFYKASCFSPSCASFHLPSSFYCLTTIVCCIEPACATACPVHSRGKPAKTHGTCML